MPERQDWSASYKHGCINRRRFLNETFVATAGLAASIPWSINRNSGRAEAEENSVTKLILGTPITHSDWMLKDNRPEVVWGKEGVRHMLNVCKAAGMSEIYWRVLDAGRAMYKSQLVLPAEHFEFDQFYNPATPAEKALLESFHMDYQRRGHSNRTISEMFDALDYCEFDSFAAALEIGHELDLKIHAWVTINEDDHGWGGASAFSRLWPEYRWVRRDGRPYRSQMSFAFPQVREYKLGIIRELLAYNLDGLFIDWLRTGDVRDNPQTDSNGVADYGYERPSIVAFRKKYKTDPRDVENNDARWIATRAEPRTEFMREVRKLCGRRGKRLPISVLVANPWCYHGLGDKISGSLNGLLCDVPTWAREELIDSAVPGGYFKDGGSTEDAYRRLVEETRGRISVWPYEWVPKTVEDFTALAGRARRVGAKHILFWEGDYFDDSEPAARQKLAAVMRAAAM
jgi:uncharacterized lipoprotein YddW (UPF0748 family)